MPTAPRTQLLIARLHLLVRSLKRAAREIVDRLSTVAGSIISLDRFDVFACTYAMSPAALVRPDLEFRPLTSGDFAVLRHRSDRFGDQTRLYYDKRGIDSAFGVFVGGELGHVSWAYTANEYKREPYERFRLRAREAEIVNCYTSDAYRGQGLYPLAIRMITASLLSRGFDRVFMNIEPSNEASRRGILKAGLTQCGRVWHLRSPAIAKWHGIYWFRAS